MNYIDRTSDLISKFPGIGKKTALRLVYYLLKESPKFSLQLGEALANLHEHIVPCELCGNYSEEQLCEICSNELRNKSTICVVALPQDVFAIESSQSYDGIYHVLGGLISPLNGVGPDNLSIAKLQERIQHEEIKEIILATNPSIEGETTARYIAKYCQHESCNFSRIAQGMPMGGDFEYIDKYTLAQSLHSRVKLVREDLNLS